ncbi:putative proline iminopeptidase [Jimgerdemannia flammicorona]|uniref:Proline iminopeptidase n=1 Tax=Jimgerdemannia flammicorona TaxID=994334 RepID=A0A433QFE2_9FUNG|nr:putative proline iminopeptidase [Jimgerdemannia flammicorona]
MTQQQPNLTPLYAPVEPYNTGSLKVSDLHTLYYEENGNPVSTFIIIIIIIAHMLACFSPWEAEANNGNPVVFVHGGPGGGTGPDDRRFFNQQPRTVSCFDSTFEVPSSDFRAGHHINPRLPHRRSHSELEDNNTWALVADMEKLREHLGIDKWVVFGGSWGSTLSLTYAIKHPKRVKALVLRGIFTLRKAELDWFYEDKNGASFIYPDAWEAYVKPIPESERGNFVAAYHRRLTSKDPAEQQAAATAWSIWECSTSRLYLDPAYVARAANDKWALAFARIENHYFINKGFFDSDTWILDNVHVLREHNIPGVIVQGRYVKRFLPFPSYDVVCPATTAWELHRRWPEADLHIVADAGHSQREPGIAAKLVEAADQFKGL